MCQKITKHNRYGIFRKNIKKSTLLGKEQILLKNVFEIMYYHVKLMNNKKEVYLMISAVFKEEVVEIQGKVKKFFAKDELTGFVIAAVVPTGGVDPNKITVYGTYSVKGYGYLTEDGEYTFKGRWLPKTKYGYTFEFFDYSKVVPKDEDAIKAYLCSKMFKGIGPSLAEKIVNKFGTDTLKVLELYPERLLEVEGIGEKKYAQMMEGYKKNEGLEQLVMFLSSYNVSIKKILKIYEKYGDESVKMISKNPYSLCDDIDGFGFVTADIIAHKVGIAYDAYPRLRAGIIHLLKEAANLEGHLYLPAKELHDRFFKLFEKSNLKEHRYKEVLFNMIRNADIIKEDEHTAIYLPEYYKTEKYVSHKTRQLISEGDTISKLDQYITEVQAENKITYAEKQIEAIKMLNCGSSFYIITGGPGTGKSTIIKAIVGILKKDNKNIKIAMAAPTGRAAKRMEEATGHPASTIHRLLEYNPHTGFTRNAENPLDCDVLIIDESSMIDIFLFSNLINAIQRGTRLIMVGDIDQLPPVGAGYVFRDLIHSGSVPVVQLNRVFRQGEGSAIKVNAQNIRNGEIKLEQKKGQFETMLHFKSGEQEEIQSTIIKEFNRALAEEFKKSYKKHPLYNVQILTPMRKGLLGVNALNKKLQAICNPKTPGTQELVFKGKEEDTIFRVGDKVMQIVNDYDKEVFNGDLGMITDIKNTENTSTLYVEFEDGKIVEYDKTEVRENLVLAYATTVHKSQGSEYNQVIAITSTAHYFMLQRNLLYTAVTRAKERVVLIGDYKALMMSIKTVKSVIRYSRLQELLQGK